MLFTLRMEMGRAMSVLAVILAVLVGCGGEYGGSEGGPSTPPAPTTTADGTPAAPPSSDVPPPPPPPKPIAVAPEDLEKWVWIPIAGTRCADDSEAGIGVNFTNQSRELVVFFQGNGVCYDALTCNLFKDLLVGMGPDPIEHLWWGNEKAGEVGIFDRSDATNPFRKSNFVVFPHCTIDAHTADKDSEYPGVGVVHQHGYANVTKALPLIVPTFADATRVVVAGFSAGGIGATANYHQIATAFEAVGKPPPLLINDSGPILRPPFLSKGAQDRLRAGWGLDVTLDAFCPKCASDGLHAIYETIAELHPGVRSSQLCAYSDSVVTMLYRLLNTDINVFDGTKLRNGLFDLEGWMADGQTRLAPSAHRSYYFVGDQHGTMVVGPLKDRAGLTAFLTAQVEGDSTWATVKP